MIIESVLMFAAVISLQVLLVRKAADMLSQIQTKTPTRGNTVYSAPLAKAA